MVQPDRPGHGIGFLTCGHAVLVEPDIRGWCVLLEEQQIGADGGIRPEHGIGQAHDGVQIALFHQVFLESCLDALAKQRAVGQHHGGAPTRLQQADNKSQEQVCGLLGPKLFRKVGLNTVLLPPDAPRPGIKPGRDHPPHNFTLPSSFPQKLLGTTGGVPC